MAKAAVAYALVLCAMVVCVACASGADQTGRMHHGAGNGNNPIESNMFLKGAKNAFAYMGDARKAAATAKTAAAAERRQSKASAGARIAAPAIVYDAIVWNALDVPATATATFAKMATDDAAPDVVTERNTLRAGSSQAYARKIYAFGSETRIRHISEVAVRVGNETAVMTAPFPGVTSPTRGYGITIVPCTQCTEGFELRGSVGKARMMRM